MKRESEPFVMYFHVWELDAEQPRIHGAPWLMRQRHYRNLERMPAILGHYLTRYEGTSIARHLELEQRSVPASELAAASTPVPAVLDTGGPRTPVTIVVPCYNESAGLSFLRNNLDHVEEVLSVRYEVKVLFVDDGSTDDTLQQLRALFGDRANHSILPMKHNVGVARAILAGIEAAETDVVCSIDCDCTYDPAELKHMIPRLVDGVDLVTGSPYHPDGQVLGVPGWRLVLSRGASWLYRRTLKVPLHTFTSCFRVYRRSTMLSLELRERGFLGVAELLARVLRNGGRVVEHPATLKVRVFGQSKMKTVRAIAGHLKLLTRLSMEERGRPSSKSQTL